MPSWEQKGGGDARFGVAERRASDGDVRHHKRQRPRGVYKVLKRSRLGVQIYSMRPEKLEHEC